MRHGIVLFTCDHGRWRRPSPHLITCPAAGEFIWGLPDGPAGEVEAYLDRRAARLGI